MKKILVASALAIATLSVSPMMAAPALAQAKSIAVADLEGAIRQSSAMQAAGQQIQTTYKAQLDQQETREQTLQAELNVLVAKLNEESKKTPQNQTALQAAAKAVQDKRQAANVELSKIGEPVEIAASYAQEQVQLRLNEAVKAAMTARKVDLLLSPEAVIARENNADITAAVVAEINRLVPTVSIAAPAGYRPGQLLQNAARAAQGAAPAAPAAPAPTGSAPTTR
ncbi:OmpH family outer membrane protein [Sphingopyxis sp. KK2]|uniref:OmpH family outer membrane protein n=1 Tax=Sphingopyxis sp. KK2 TaxID=1855727 RepID=UPI00097E5C5E|nr:OmpH family outer membrane protein [Sphingopyxis sp. KK2]